MKETNIPRRRYRTDPRWLDLRNWPQVDERTLADGNKKLAEYRRNVRIVKQYIEGAPLRSICTAEDIDVRTIQRLIARCFELHPDGLIQGFRAAIPYRHIAPYQRVAMTTTAHLSGHGGNSGALMQCMEMYPAIRTAIEERLNNWIRDRTDPLPAPPIQIFHAAFIAACRRENLHVRGLWPFNTAYLGMRAVGKFVHRSIDQRREGASGAFVASEGGEGGRSMRGLLQLLHPYQCVEFDGHKIDAQFVIDVPTPDGLVTSVCVSRIWLLLIVDTVSRAVLAYYLSLEGEYTEDDTLTTFANLFKPWQRRVLSVPNMIYHPSGGLPSGVFEALIGAPPQRVRYDNAKCHLSSRVIANLEQTIGCSVEAGPVGDPDQRAVVERLFGLLTKRGFQHLVSGTGSHPKDSNRVRDPEKAAKSFKVRLDDLEELADVVISDYNGYEHSSLYGRTPLESLRYYLSDPSFVPGRLEHLGESASALLSRRVICIVRGSRIAGRAPHITYKGAAYTSSLLLNTWGLIGRPLVVHIQEMDGRQVRTFLQTGETFDTLHAKGVWGTVLHSMRVREAILKLRRRGALHYAISDNPVEAYNDYLRARARKSRRAAKRWTSLNRQVNRFGVESASAGKDEEAPRQGRKKKSLGSPKTVSTRSPPKAISW